MHNSSAHCPPPWSFVLIMDLTNIISTRYVSFIMNRINMISTRHVSFIMNRINMISTRHVSFIMNRNNMISTCHVSYASDLLQNDAHKFATLLVLRAHNSGVNKVGQNHIYMVYIRCCWQGNHQ